MKRVIFVGGTEYSGSTFFHMILANAPGGLAIGEVHNLFRPTRSHHFHMQCSCGEQPGALWESIRSRGEGNLYRNLFEEFQDVDFIVDSSKNPLWISDQVKYLSAQGISAQQVLMWKTPYELAHSYDKRGQAQAWQRSWEVYHRVYYTLIEGWRAVPYRDFATQRATLTAVCDYLGLADFEGKERYWEREQHVLGGNPSARVHLYAQDSEHFRENVDRSSSKIDVTAAGTHRSIHYSTNLKPELREMVDRQVAESATIEPILNLLQARDVRVDITAEADNADLKMRSIAVQARRLKKRLLSGKAQVSRFASSD